RLPTIDCASGNMTSERAKLFAAKRTKIALYYTDYSRLKKQLYSGADWYFTFGAMPIVVEPDVAEKRPTMRIDDPRGAYWQTDPFGKVRFYCKTWQETVGSLIVKFPDLRTEIIGNSQRSFGSSMNQEPGDLSQELKVARLYTKTGTYVFLPDRGNLLLTAAPQPLGRVPVEIAELPKWDAESRGHFDDVMWVWLARARMALYGMEAADKSIRAPLAVPQDVQKIPLGADAMIRSAEADKIRRVPIELPPAALVESQLLQQEVEKGAAYPQARAGTLDASIITGKGVEALAGQFSTQIAAAQDDVGDAIRRALELCFVMDEKFWPKKTSTIRGMSNGAPFTETYTPAKDIKGDHTVSVTYGFTAGMDPNRALVFLLQLRGDRAIDRGTLQRQLPFEVDTVQLNEQIDIEEMEDALKQGVYAMLSSMAMMVEQGQDPTDLLQKVSKIVAARKKGQAMYEAISDAFTPEPQPQAPQNPLQALMGGGGPQDQATGAGPLAMQAGSAPDLQTMLAGLSASGKPNLRAAVSRRIPA
ncbi:MAG TPA: hypothetical protein VFI97_02950, partial [Arthrobacter sp.]|nr:hypothetical protein [Arthrobacter sp.]